MVDHDLFLIVGLAIIGLSLISLLAALVEDRLPLVAGICLALGTGLSAWGLIGGETWPDPSRLPHIFFEVLGRYLP